MSQYEDLAPGIHRQRLVIEGYPGFVITDEHIVDYLSKLSSVLKMRTLIFSANQHREKRGVERSTQL
jgi:hypothetical protein